MGKLKIEHLPIDLLVPSTFNVNVVSPENEKKIDASLERFGFFKPLLCREIAGNLEIIGGEHRWHAARRLGHFEVPVINLGAISDQQAKEISLVDNGRYGESDSLELAALLNGMENLDEIMGFLPYAEDDLSAIFASSSIDFDSLDIPDDADDKIPELPTKAAVQTHQVMRFKVPVEDSEKITALIERTMKSEGFTDDDSMTNAGNALVHLLKDLK